MDDGYKSGNGICLSTESFTLSEVELLRDILITKFDLVVNLQVRHPAPHRWSRE